MRPGRSKNVRGSVRGQSSRSYAFCRRERLVGCCEVFITMKPSAAAPRRSSRPRMMARARNALDPLLEEDGGGELSLAVELSLDELGEAAGVDDSGVVAAGAGVLGALGVNVNPPP